MSTILRKNGASFLTYPSAFAYSTGIAHWESLLRARAIENQCYVIAAAQAGYHNAKRQPSYGRAMIIDPWGQIIAECSNENKEPHCVTSKIELDLIKSIQERLPCFDHRRSLYTLHGAMIPPINSIDSNFFYNPVETENEETPYFVFEKYPVPKSTTFIETSLSIAFTNITCVVPGRK